METSTTTFFVGEFTHSLDSKGRVTIPSKWRIAGGENTYLALPNPGRYITVYPPKMVARLEEKVAEANLSDVRAQALLMELFSKAHSFGAEVFVDAVHYAPHALIDIREMGCDYLACSSYKFFGTHQGILWGRYNRLAELPVAKLRVSSEDVPFRWMTGTQSHESMAGTLAAIEHLAWLGRIISDDDLSRREALRVAFSAIEDYESELCWSMIQGLQEIDGVRIWGVTDPSMKKHRAPTVSFTHPSMTAEQIGAALAEKGIFAWAGNFYALELSEALGLEPEGALRVGLLHYNTKEEVDRFIDVLNGILG